MKTALQELIEQLEKIRKNNCIKADENILFKGIISISKLYIEKEKQQIIEAGNSCALKQHILNSKIEKMTVAEIVKLADLKEDTFGEQYYKETFEQ